MRLDNPKRGEIGKCVLRRSRLFRTSKRHFSERYASECPGILPVRRYFLWDFMLLATALADKRPSVRAFHDTNYSVTLFHSRRTRLFADADRRPGVPPKGFFALRA